MSDDEEATNPLFAGLDDGKTNPPISSWFAQLAARIRPPPPPTVVLAPPPQSSNVPIIMKTKGCSCRAVLILVVLTIALTLIISLTLVAIFNKSASMESAGNTMASFLTRYAALQQHYAILGHVDTYGDEPSASDVRLETTSLKSFSRIAGSVDLHTQRFDWNLRVNDAHGQLGARMTLALWVQRYDTGTHLMRHTTHSPLVLCANLSTSATCAGHLDKPPADLSTADELDPRLLGLAVYADKVTRVNQTSEPLWIFPIQR